MRFLVLIALISFVLNGIAEDKTETLFQQDFEKIEDTNVPADFLILEGDFAVQEKEQNKVLFLPGTPLSDYGALFGPSASEGLQISAKILSERLKRQFPRMGVGLGGVNGFKLFVTPSKRVLEIFRNGETLASVPFRWESGEWAHFRFQIRKVDEEWVIEGKTWQGDEEPAQWMVRYNTDDSPVSGKSSVWGTPYSSQDIFFDDIVILPSS